jgi:quercetin dioxygenase-like cupin family protein
MRLHVPERTVELTPGNLLVLDTEVPHDVEAVEESAFLLTVCAAAHK